MARENRSEYTANVQMSTVKAAPTWAQPSKRSVRVEHSTTHNKTILQKLFDKLNQKG